MSNEALIAEFLAKGGRVVQCEPGAKALTFTERDWYRQVRGLNGTDMPSEDQSMHAIEARAERRAELATDFARCGDTQAALEARAGHFDH